MSWPLTGTSPDDALASATSFRTFVIESLPGPTVAIDDADENSTMAKGSKHDMCGTEAAKVYGGPLAHLLFPSIHVQIDSFREYIKV